MNLKFFLLGLCVLVSIVQISTAQHYQEGPPDHEDNNNSGYDGDANGQGGDAEDHTEEEIEQRRKITSIMNSAVNIIDPEEKQQQEIYDVKNTNTNFLAQLAQPSSGGSGGGLLGTLFDLGSKLLPMLKPLWGLVKNMFPMLKNLLGPLLKIITKGMPLLSNLLQFVQPLLALPAKIAKYLKQLFDCLKTIFGVLLSALKFLLNGLKTLYNLLPVLKPMLDFIPNVIHGLWRVWRSIRYTVLYPIRTFKRWLQRIVRFFYGVPRYLGAILRSIGHFLVSPVRILGFLFKRGFIAFNDYVIVPVARLKYFLINLFDVLLGPLNIIRHFLEELACLFVKTPLRVIRSIIRAFFVNGILNTIRYIKTVIYEIIVFPWSHHYADMFPSLGNRHNYILPKQVVCQGTAC